MRLEREVMLGLAVILLILGLISFGAVGLLSRMSPAIEHILEENVLSLAAVEEMLAEVTRGEDGEPSARFEAALMRARENITEPEETEILAAIDRHKIARTAEDRATLVADLRRLGEINRAAMTVADRRAQRIGVAGAWSGVFLALFGLVMSWVVIHRLRTRLLAPLVEICEVLEATSKGDAFRRCHPVTEPRELAVAMERLNAVLDRCQVGGARPVATGDPREG